YNISTLEQKLNLSNTDFIKFLGAINLFKSLVSKEGNVNQSEQVKHAKSMLWQLYNENPAIKEFIDGNIAFFNGIKGKPDSFDALDKVLSEQFFRLSFWKVASEEINYRRFFTVNEFISVKVEDEAVFNHTHQLIFKLINEGVLSGLRVDHIDGLYDPMVYLKKLREKVGDIFVVVEKILAPAEELPRQWPVQGTTGYDFLNYVNGVFCRINNKMAFNKLYKAFTEITEPFEELVCNKKRLIISKHLAGNIDNLAHLLKKISSKDKYGRDITPYGLRRALVEVMASFPVYRTYINYDLVREADTRYIKEAVNNARERLPGFFYEINFIEKFLLLKYNGSLSEDDKRQWIEFVINFQQYTAPLMAKGFEDTILYVYNRLVSLNEVGGSPQRFGFSSEEFYNFNQKKAAVTPYSLNTTSTHDTKRGEDIRARLNVLSEIPQEWERYLKSWSKANKKKKRKVHDNLAPDENDEYLFYQTLLGAFPFEGQSQDFTDRIKVYLIKAVREAKWHTAWIKPDEEYEEACVGFIEEILRESEDNQFLKDFLSFQKKIAYYGMLNSLSQVLLKIASPGVADFYQGTELWDLNLVDPDNRRLVDFQKRVLFLQEIEEKAKQDPINLINGLLSHKEDGRIKLFLIYSLLEAGKKQIALFQEGSYMPLEAQGKFKDNVIAFMRKHEQQCAITIAPRFYTALIKEDELPLGEEVWSDTHIILPKEASFTWEDAIIGRRVDSKDNKLFIGKTLIHFPVALLLNITS
ncbi:MAG: malto-oligosyltrehalose synthase, partial [Proteobacteria bacterium]|nr:malto-oligosyltrehalose synthase [Pseudomonadota bacterium]